MSIFSDRIKLAVKHKNSQMKKPNTYRMPDLGIKLYPHLWPKNKPFTTEMKKQLNTAVGKLKGGKGVKMDQLFILCNELNVDPNFLFGYPSKYDFILKLYNKSHNGDN